MTKRRRGHFCWSCGRSRPNETFSGRGHARHVCRECSRLGKKELKYRQAVRNVDRALRSHNLASRHNRAVLERSLQHPDPRVQLYVAELIYQGERERAESRLAWEQDEPPSDRMLAQDKQVLIETDLAAVFREMEDNHLDPSADEFEQTVNGPGHTAGWFTGLDANSW